jgi:DNA primase
VSVPLTWDELKSQKVSNAFTVKNLHKHLAKLRSDPWARIAKIKQALPASPRKARGR